MNPLLHALPFDKTGMSVNNLVLGEMHDLSAMVNLPNRCFVLDHGYFYKASLGLEDSTGYTLTEGVDYQVTSASQTLMGKTGLEVCAVIVITNPNVASRLFVTAQMVGGREGTVAESIARMATQVLNTGRPVLWKNVTDKLDSYTPSGHFHPMWQLYGFEGFMASSQRVTAALKKRSQQRYEVIEERFDGKLAQVKANGAVEKQKLAAHVARKDNPHNLRAVQVSLEKVMNYALATDDEAKAKGSSVKTKYMTPYLGKLSIQANFIDALNVHKSDTNNPHKVTPAQVGSYSYAEANDRFNTKLGINEQAVNSTLFVGKTYQSVYDELRSGLHAEFIASVGRFPQWMLGSGGYDAGWVLAGNGQWRQIQEMFNTYGKQAAKVFTMSGLFGSADAGINQASVTFADNTAYPYGTLVLFTVQDGYSIGNGNGSTYTKLVSLYAAVKMADGWHY